MQELQHSGGGVSISMRSTGTHPASRLPASSATPPSPPAPPVVESPPTPPAPAPELELAVVAPGNALSYAQPATAISSSDDSDERDAEGMIAPPNNVLRPGARVLRARPPSAEERRRGDREQSPRARAIRNSPDGAR